MVATRATLCSTDRVGIRVEKPGEFAGALERALRANCPVVIDVVTDIEALAPLAVT